MSKRFKSYFSFSHPLISKKFNANECAWAYRMNIFDIEAWRNTNISQNYHYWLDQKKRLENSNCIMLPPDLIAFHGYVHIIDPFWHMLDLEKNTSISDAETAADIHLTMVGYCISRASGVMDQIRQFFR
ncbi:hypothetical protein L1987_55659 [Smallanthus sonchifolius]|uniref:Uncharacterized protein n=1 Tax=Smallanthus sonchifolius TaxID=185202 RepID=A0ACB9EAH8_9ASTR|nr:hypothetical protein L1987_55659 [Smallanthus sonchifolius]